MNIESLLSFLKQNLVLNEDTPAREVWRNRLHVLEESVAVYDWHYWTPPDWIRAGWIAMDADGKWRWYEQQPTLGDMWWINSAEAGSRSTVCIDGPPCKDWKTSLRKVKEGAKANLKGVKDTSEAIRQCKKRLSALYTQLAAEKRAEESKRLNSLSSR